MLAACHWQISQDDDGCSNSQGEVLKIWQWNTGEPSIATDKLAVRSGLLARQRQLWQQLTMNPLDFAFLCSVSVKVETVTFGPR